MDTNIKVSIVLPACNVAQTISKTIESVLNQTYTNFELIIIDDGSTDRTAEEIKKNKDPRIIYIKNEKNLGLIETLNKGISISKGKYIARIDGDDIWITNNKLQKQIEFLDMNPGHILIGTQAFLKNKNSTGTTHYPITDSQIKKRILSKNPFIHSSIMFRKDKIDINPYNKDQYLVEDYALWLELGTKGKIANLPDYDVEYLINPQGETQTKNLTQTINSYTLIKKYKNIYPNYMKAYIGWNIKILIRKILLHLK